MVLDARHLEAWRARLTGPQNLALTAQFQILLGNQKPILGFPHDRQTALGGFAMMALLALLLRVMLRAPQPEARLPRPAGVLE